MQIAEALVSILVLMEVVLKASFQQSLPVPQPRFNPCFDGSGSQSKAERDADIFVLKFQSLF
ncbi:Uncharacterized protein dnm_098330 [Desulfonema magnum]|uniref:Uncharacterized protein n=1 Tax=Desulfonema magnum TaxID=45655 RepID=A0A975C0C0_9BACT|nr:Uncharacterized protein dnm_098330 [Desulfonema magnum]